MKIMSLKFMIPLLALPLLTQAAEPWRDDRLAVVAGLEFWFDCSHQNAGRSALQLPPLGSGNAVDYLLDGSGHGHHLAQPQRPGRPVFHQEFNGAFLSFDGQDDALATSLLGLTMTNLTVFLVAAPFSNEGDFRAFFGLNQLGRNDYTSGLNFDLGPVPTTQLAFLNAEGNGFGGAAQLWQGPGLPFRGWHIFGLQCQGGATPSVRFLLDGHPQRARDRQLSPIHADEFVLGARRYSNTGEPPYVQGFLHGQMAEFLLFNRSLTDVEMASVHQYLQQKYGLLLGRPPGGEASSKSLVTVTNPPPMQFLLPGFTVRELPLALNNINNLKYRPDGKLVALGYNGQVYLLTDTDGDGLEDHAEPFWTNPGGTIRSPIGMALTPPGYSLGQGVFVAAKGRLSLIVDTNQDNIADQEIVVAEGWRELAHGVDALGVALDAQGNIYFGLGAASFTEPYLVDKTTGQARYDLKSERGTILRVSPDFKKRDIFCTGIRFSVALAFNEAGDLFCTDQEGATWLPNGNPLDELLHVQAGRHYGFPPRHPQHLPAVIDEPSVFDYAPQHQSTCGLNFNYPVNGGPVFGPSWWAGDALVSGYSRGKIWRTKLVKTAQGYVAQTQLMAALSALTVDACVSPRGDLVVSTHSGDPDWGSGPNGRGRLYQVRYSDRSAPLPSLVWASDPSELRIAFDKPLDPLTLRDLAKHTEITQGQAVVAGDRFEVKRPGYAVVYSQLAMPRYDVPVESIAVTPDLRTLILKTKRVEAAVNYGITIHGLRPLPSSNGRSGQSPDVDLLADLTGVTARWQASEASLAASSGGPVVRDTWLPHLDLAVARELSRMSAEQEAFWESLNRPGTLTFRTQLDLWQMLQPAIQPGSKLDYERPVEQVSVLFQAAVPFTIRTGNVILVSEPAEGGVHQVLLRRSSQQAWVPLELMLSTGPQTPRLEVSWSTGDDPRPRAFPLRRFYVPWARRSSDNPGAPVDRVIPELAGGNWLRGRHLFFGETAACFKCHRIRGQGGRVGPDLSNLVQRDYASVYRDISNPNAALNPDHLAYAVELIDGEELTGVLHSDTPEQVIVANASGTFTFPKTRVKEIRPSGLSLMPEGLDKVLTRDQLRDLMTFLLTQPLEPAAAEIQGQPRPRPPAEIDRALKPVADAVAGPQTSPAPFTVVLCAGPKDHGAGEHDYPLWQKRWVKLLALAENVQVRTAWEWPSPEQWQSAQVMVFYSDLPGWNAARATQLESYLARGGGAAFIHFAVDGHTNVEELARSIGLAWRGGASKFRHGALDLDLVPGPLTAGLSTPMRLIDESYWNLVGDPKTVELAGNALEEGSPRPLLWTVTRGQGRVFVSIPGHYTWTFDDPLFRLLLLRGISWAGHQPVERLSELATVGSLAPPD